MRILVVGGAGYIGSHTVKRLLAEGHDAWVYDNLSTGHRAGVPGDRLLVADLADEHRLDQTLIQHRIEAVVHFAALALVGESVHKPALYYRNNVRYSLNLLDAMHRTGVQKIVFSSTCATYGIPEKMPITEDFPQNPISPYGRTKLAIEFALRDYASAYGFGVAILRYFNAAGAAADGTIGEDHDPESHLIPLIIQSVMGQRPALQVMGTDYPTRDGTCIRDYVHVDDLATAHMRALERVTPYSPIICNLGTGNGASVREVIQAVEEVTGKKVPIEIAPRREGDPPIMIARGDRARELLGWEPVYKDPKSIIETAWNWHRSHPHGYDDKD